MSSKTFVRIAAFLILAAATLVGGIRGFGRIEGQSDHIETAYTEALSVVTENYADEVDFDKAGEAAIQGMLSALDPHSNFFTKAEYQRLLQDQESRFTGIGVSILRRRDGVYVQTPLEGTPAAKAGLRYGDRIVDVDGKDATNWTTPEVSKAVRGPEGERVTIKIDRAGANAPQFYTIVRGSVPQPSIRNAFMVRPGVGYIGMTGGFTQTTAEELRRALEELRREGMQHVILDLRNNPGGLLGQSIEVASQFVERGKSIVSVRGRDGEGREYKNTTSEPVTYPLVVLINRNSASASEIVAGAVQDHGRGILVGETSFGKGLVQKVFQLPYGAGLTLTTAKYYTPYGRLIQREYTGGSFYEYYTRQVAGAGPTPQTPAQPTTPAVPGAEPSNVPTPLPTPQATPSGPPVKTAAGRVFYGGGGITPDHEVKPLDLTVPARVRIFEESFFFVRALVAGQIPGFDSYRLTAGPQFGRFPRANDLPVTDKLLEAFRAFVRKDPESGLGMKQLEADLDYAKLRIRDDLITAAYGTDAAGRFLLEGDPQLFRALELFPEARTLAENVRRAGASE